MYLFIHTVMYSFIVHSCTDLKYSVIALIILMTLLYSCCLSFTHLCYFIC